MDLWPVTIQARHSLSSTFDGLDAGQWETQSLCGGWTIRQVLAHLILAARPPAMRYAAAVARARGSFDEANRALAVADGIRSTSDLMDEYRRVMDHRFSPPGWPDAAPFSDVLLHTLDVRIPLGLGTDVPPDHWEPVLDLLFARLGRRFTSGGRPSVRWVATDHEWSRGSGPEVTGSMADLALTVAGRPARLDALEGEGTAALAAWLR